MLLLSDSNWAYLNYKNKVRLNSLLTVAGLGPASGDGEVHHPFSQIYPRDDLL